MAALGLCPAATAGLRLAIGVASPADCWFRLVMPQWYLLLGFALWGTGLYHCGDSDSHGLWTLVVEIRRLSFQRENSHRLGAKLCCFSNRFLPQVPCITLKTGVITLELC